MYHELMLYKARVIFASGIKLGGDLGEIVALGAKISPKLGSGRSGSLLITKKKKKK